MTGQGEKPILLWAATDTLHVNPSYQRSAETNRSKKVIAHIINNFHWPQFQPVTIVERDEGGYWVIDGQHRMQAAREMKMLEIPATLVILADEAAHARAFVGINSVRVSMNAQAIFHGRVNAGEVDAVALNKCCEKAGVVIPRYSKMLGLIKPNETMSITTMRNVIQLFGGDALIWALRLLRKTYPDEGGMLDSISIRTIATFYNVYQDFKVDEAALSEALLDFDFKECWRLILKDVALTGIKAKNVDLVEMLADAYNEVCHPQKSLPAPSAIPGTV